MENQTPMVPSRQTEEKPKTQKIVNGPVKVKKKSNVSKFADSFIAEDASKVKEYIVADVLIPAAKKLIADVITNGIDMILYGGNAASRKGSTAANKVSYRDYYSNNRNQSPSYRTTVTRSTYSYDDVVIPTRGDAEAVLSQMDEIVATYGFVRVADLYDLVGITGSYTDNNYGWTDIRSARIDRVRDGYIIKLPRALPID